MNSIEAPVTTGSMRVAPQEPAVTPGTPGRLVIVAPDVADAALLAGQIHRVAQVRNLEVLLIGVSSSLLSEPELRRRLTLLAAFLRDAGVKADVRVESGRAWIPEIRALVGEQDLLGYCVAEGSPGSGAQLIEILDNQSKRPVHAFMDAGSQDSPKRSIAAQVAPWAGSIAIIVGFFWLQAWLSQHGEGGGYDALVIASVAVEAGLVWLLNAVLG